VPVALVFPIVLWIAVRCRPVFAAAAAFIVALIVACSTALALGDLGRPLSNLVLEWQEVGGPRVDAPDKSSYGTSTIQDLLPYEFGGKVDLVFAPEGVRCRLELPPDWLTDAGEPTEVVADTDR